MSKEMKGLEEQKKWALSPVIQRARMRWPWDVQHKGESEQYVAEDMASAYEAGVRDTLFAVRERLQRCFRDYSLRKADKVDVDSLETRIWLQMVSWMEKVEFGEEGID